MFGAIGGALAGVAGDLIGGYLSDERAADAAHKQMDFQARMSNTSYQRAVKDLLKAGLNPMLAYSQGGASTPSGSLAHTADLSSLGSKAVEAYNRSAQVSSAVDLNRAQAAQATTQAALNSASKAKTEAQTLNEVAQNPILKKTVDKVVADTKSALAAAESHSAQAAKFRVDRDVKAPYAYTHAIAERGLEQGYSLLSRAWNSAIAAGRDLLESRPSNANAWTPLRGK